MFEVPIFHTGTVNSLSIILIVLVSTFFLGAVFGEIYMVSMRDGVRLATRVYLPDGEGPWPTLLARTPYGSIWPSDLARREEFKSWGYAVVVQDVRGFQSSQGEQVPFRPDGWGELQDGYDTVEWIAQQSWSDGRVGTLGGSYLGAVQNLLAGSYPPHLVCQYIFMCPINMYSHHYVGGVFRRACWGYWYIDWVGSIGPSLLRESLSHPNYDSYWEGLNAETRFAGMTYPGFHVGGWYDPNLRQTINNFVGRQYSGAEGSLGNQKLIIGPWQHFNYKPFQGDLEFPDAGLYSGIGLDLRAFFDYWLKDIDNGYTDLSPVRYYVMGDADDPDAPGNEWRSAEDWPIPCTNFTLYLSQNGEEGQLLKQPGSGSVSGYSFNPTNFTDQLGGRLYPDPNKYGGPKDQRPIENRDDVLVFTTQPLTVPVEVTGQVLARLFISSNCSDTDFVVKLCDVYPDGRSILVTYGIIRASHRNSMETKEYLEPGEVYEVEVDLWSTSMVFNKGHRIKVLVTSSSFPEFDTNPNTGQEGGGYRVAENKVHMGTSYPSAIILPLAGPDSDGDGTSDILDPMPNENGTDTGDDILTRINHTESLIPSLSEQKLKILLQEMSQAARNLLEDDDLVASGHLLLQINEILTNNDTNLSLAESREIYDEALDQALAYLAENSSSHRQMVSYLPAQYIDAGCTLGATWELCDCQMGRELLMTHLEEAKQVMSSGLPGWTTRIAEWCGMNEAHSLADRITLYQNEWPKISNDVSEKDLEMLEAILSKARNEFLSRDEEGCHSSLVQLQQRLTQLGIHEKIPFHFLFTALVLVRVKMGKKV